jgi:hypothetical protein
MRSDATTASPIGTAKRVLKAKLSIAVLRVRDGANGSHRRAVDVQAVNKELQSIIRLL